MIHWTLLAMTALVGWAALGGLWRRGSLALAASWMLAQLWFVAKGVSTPVGLYWVLDPLVILAVIRWRSSWLDWVVLALFPAEWFFYLISDGSVQWWALFWLCGAQMLCAGPWPQLQQGRDFYSHGPLVAGGGS